MDQKRNKVFDLIGFFNSYNSSSSLNNNNSSNNINKPTINNSINNKTFNSDINKQNINCNSSNNNIINCNSSNNINCNNSNKDCNNITINNNEIINNNSNDIKNSFNQIEEKLKQSSKSSKEIKDNSDEINNKLKINNSININSSSKVVTLEQIGNESVINDDNELKESYEFRIPSTNSYNYRLSIEPESVLSTPSYSHSLSTSLSSLSSPVITPITSPNLTPVSSPIIPRLCKINNNSSNVINHSDSTVFDNKSFNDLASSFDLPTVESPPKSHKYHIQNQNDEVKSLKDLLSKNEIRQSFEPPEIKQDIDVVVVEDIDIIEATVEEEEELAKDDNREKSEFQINKNQKYSNQDSVPIDDEDSLELDISEDFEDDNNTVDINKGAYLYEDDDEEDGHEEEEEEKEKERDQLISNNGNGSSKNNSINNRFILENMKFKLLPDGYTSFNIDNGRRRSSTVVQTNFTSHSNTASFSGDISTGSNSEILTSTNSEFNQDSNNINQESIESSIFQIKILDNKFKKEQHIQDDWNSQKIKDYHWNSKFQEIISLPDEDSSKSKRLFILVNEFVTLAEKIGKMLISEVKLTDEKKTIKPWKIGGQAGGIKYKCHDIIFKFVTDLKKSDNKTWVYGGDKKDDGMAQKSASHELKGLNHFRMSHSNSIRTPLMAVISHLGYKVTAISNLPIIKDDTIVYGSNNSGVDVHTSKLIHEEMRLICKDLNLAEHSVNGRNGTKLSIFGPVDIEIHKINNHYYGIDFSRLFPPEDPQYSSSSSNKNFTGGDLLSKLLRPELVNKSKNSLSSDAFFTFQHQDDEAIQNEKVSTITKTLHNIVIPEFAKHIDNNSFGTIKRLKPSKSIYDSIFSSPESNNNNNYNNQQQQQNNNNNNDKNQIINSNNNNNNILNEWILKSNRDNRDNNDLNFATKSLPQKSSYIKTYIDELHSSGINLRYLGLVSSKLTTKSLKNLLQTEMSARVWKRYIGSRIRQIENPTDLQYKSILSYVFELILYPYDSLENKEFWCFKNPHCFKYIALNCFYKSISEEDQNEEIDYRNKIDNRLLVYRLIQMLNIKINAEAMNQFLSNSNYIITFHDIEEVGSKIKYLSIVDVAAGSFLLDEAIQSLSQYDSNPLATQRLIENAKNKFLSALCSMPLSTQVMLKLGRCHLLYDSTLSINNKQSIDNINSALTHINSTEPSVKALLGILYLKLATYQLFNDLSSADFKKILLKLKDSWSNIQVNLIIDILVLNFNQFGNNNNSSGNSNSNGELFINEKKSINELLVLCIAIDEFKHQFNFNLNLKEFFIKIKSIKEFSIPLPILNYFYEKRVSISPITHQQLVSDITLIIFSKINNLSTIELNEIVINDSLLDQFKYIINLKITNCKFIFNNNKSSNSNSLCDPVNEILLKCQLLTNLYIDFKIYTPQQLQSQSQSTLIPVITNALQQQQIDQAQLQLDNGGNNNSNNYDKQLTVSLDYLRLKSLSLVNYKGLFISPKDEIILNQLETLNINNSLDLFHLISKNSKIKKPSLKSISIANFRNITTDLEVDMSIFNKNITELDISSCDFHRSVVINIIKMCTGLRVLKSSANNHFSHIALISLANGYQLNKLYLDNINIASSESFFSSISNLNRDTLKVLYLPNFTRSIGNSSALSNLLKVFTHLEDFKLPHKFDLKAFTTLSNSETPIYLRIKRLNLEKCTVSISPLQTIIKISPLLESISLFGSVWQVENREYHKDLLSNLIEANAIISNNKIKELNIAECDLKKPEIREIIKLFPSLSIIITNYSKLGKTFNTNKLHFQVIKYVKDFNLNNQIIQNNNHQNNNNNHQNNNINNLGILLNNNNNDNSSDLSTISKGEKKKKSGSKPPLLAQVKEKERSSSSSTSLFGTKKK